MLSRPRAKTTRPEPRRARCAARSDAERRRRAAPPGSAGRSGPRPASSAPTVGGARRRQAGVAGLADLDAAVVDELGDDQAGRGGEDRRRRSPARGVITALARVAARTAEAAARRAARVRPARADAQDEHRRPVAAAVRPAQPARAGYGLPSAQPLRRAASRGAPPARRAASIRLGPHQDAVDPPSRPARPPERAARADARAAPLLSSRVAQSASSSQCVSPGPRGPFSCADPGPCRIGSAFVRSSPLHTTPLP